MKILILANSQKNVDLIKRNIKAIIRHHKAHYDLDHDFAIGDLNDHKIHEINDLLKCERYYPHSTEQKGKPVIKYRTDDPAHQIDVTKYDIAFVYSKFLDEEYHRHRPALMYPNPPVGILIKKTKWGKWYCL